MKLSQIIIIEAAEIDYAGIDPNIVDRLSPFPSHLQQWAIKEIKKGEHASSVVDAVEYYQTYIKDNRFQQILAKLTPSPKNILTLSLSQIKDAQTENDEKYHRVSNRELKKVRKLNYTDKLVDTSRLKIVKITKKDETDGAAKILSDFARASKWCVTNVKKADEYLSNGPLYVIYLDGEKYLYAPKNEELMNVKNEPWILSLEEYDLLSPHLPQVALHLEDQTHPDYHKAVMKSPRRAIEYAMDVINGRWPEAEPYIMKDPYCAYEYALLVIKDRWPEAEENILKDPASAALYAGNVIEDRWPEAEPIIINNTNAALSYAHKAIKGRWPEAEEVILKEPVAAELYAADVIKGRWPEAEPIIIEDPHAATYYAINIFKGRWPEAEPLIVQSPWDSMHYALHVLKDRWPEAEKNMLKDPSVAEDPTPAILYAKNVIKGRWREAEGIIMKIPEYAKNYSNLFGLHY